MEAHELRQKMTSVIDKKSHAQVIADTPILSERERHRSLYEWNDNRAEYADVCVHELFEQQARAITRRWPSRSANNN
jgi:non-ribosomal peptide synthetase component F